MSEDCCAFDSGDLRRAHAHHWTRRPTHEKWMLERLVQAGRGMVRLSIAVHAASPRAAQDLLDALHYIVLSTRLEPGCLTCTALTGTDGVSYVEEWGTEADMRRRVRSEAFTPLLAIIETAAGSEVHFDFVTRTRGLDYVAEMRNDVGA